MKEKTLFSITGLFDSSDEIGHAVEAVVKAGYKKYDVNTPFPVHGLDTKMKLPPSKLGYFALVLGLMGASAALFFMWWSISKDYPIIIGGKPYFALPAFIPITFEVTVLTASVGTVLTMLFLFFRLPNINHPLQDTNYMRNVSNDKFGISIEAEDPLFEAGKVKDFLKSLNAQDVGEIYFEEDETADSTRIFSPKFIAFLIVTAVIISGVTYFTLNKLLFMDPFNFMEEQQRFAPEGQTTFFKDTRMMRTPPAGAVARGAMPYMFANEPDSAAKELINPLQPDEKTLALGREKFNTYCSPCHDYLAKGNSRLMGQFPNPPSLHSEKVRNWPDGRIFHVITEGQNVMPSYAKQLEPNERWAVILYIRALQRAMNAKEGDLK